MRGSWPASGRFWSVNVLLCIFCSPFCSSQPAARSTGGPVCHRDDRDALLGFSRGLDSGVSGWPADAWSSNCCRWLGVRCRFTSSPKNSSLSVSGDASESRVVALDLGRRRLEGAIDWKALQGLRELRALNLSRNSLRGVITGELPPPAHLEVLDLSRNLLSGQLTDGIGNLSALRHLDISFNLLNGSIPDAFAGLRRLQTFSARSNLFTGGLPASLSSCSALTSLDLGNNSLAGKITVDFPMLPRLRTLRLDSNGFYGPIPRSLSSCSALRILSLAENELHGRIPRSFTKLQALFSLALSSNTLSNVTRAFEVLSACRNITAVDLSGNFVGETMPAGGIGGLGSLEVLLVTNSSLSGSVPSWLRSCAELRVLDLSFNRLSGSVPPFLGAFARLFYLDLSHNALGGDLPGTLADLTSLASPNNSVAGGTDDSSFDLDISLRGTWSSGRKVRYRRLASVPPAIDLSHNAIAGEIPPGFGGLIRLARLDLGSNHLSGGIPEQLSAMRSLEALDLSHNNLTGSIPPSLDRLTFLSMFSVAYNDLGGLIPEGGQFSTFPRSSYEGNRGLCSPEEVRRRGRCVSGSDGVPPAPAVLEKGFKITFMPEPFGFGIAIGFIPTVISWLCYCRRRRRRKKESRDQALTSDTFSFFF